MLDLLIYNGIIRSLDANHSTYEAIGITDGKISFLGNYHTAATLSAKKRWDANGRLVLPGFVDSHLHALDYAEMKKFVKLQNLCSVQDILIAGKKHHQQYGLYNGWLIGFGWNQNEFTDGNDFIYKKDLDLISTQVPIIFTRTCVHMAVANSKAMELILQINEAKELSRFIDPETGILRESAITLYRKILDKTPLADVKEMLLSAHQDFLEAGITQVHSADFFNAVPEEDWRKVFQAYQELSDENKLRVRTYEQCMFFKYENFEDFARESYTTGQGNEFFRIGPLKMIIDGSLGARTAYMKEPYTDDPTTQGILILQPDQIRPFLKKAKEKQMQIAVHAIGSGSMAIVADLLNEANEEDLSNPMRDGIVHVQITDLEIFDQMEKGNLTAYIQPIFLDTDFEVVEARLGKERASLAYAWKTLLDRELLVTGGSDAPVSGFNILENIYCAVTRKSLSGEPAGGWMPSQKLTVDEAVRLFTVNPSYQSFEEHLKGTLEIGKYADLVALSENIYEIPQDQIKGVQVDLTVVGGKIEYQR